MKRAICHNAGCVNENIETLFDETTWLPGFPLHVVCCCGVEIGDLVEVPSDYVPAPPPSVDAPLDEEPLSAVNTEPDPAAGE